MPAKELSVIREVFKWLVMRVKVILNGDKMAPTLHGWDLRAAVRSNRGPGGFAGQKLRSEDLEAEIGEFGIQRPPRA